MDIMSRGQSEVLAIVLLLGIVLVSAVAVVAVGSSALTSIEEQSSAEQDQNEMKSVSYNIDNSIQSDASFSMTELSNRYELSEGANVTISTDGSTIERYNTGRITHQNLVYEGGLIIDDGYVISSPDLSLAEKSSMIQIPAIQHENSNGFDGTIHHVGTDTPVTDPVDNLEIRIESDYYEHWYEQFSDANATVTKYDSNKTVHITYNKANLESTTDHALHLGMSDGSDFDLNSIPETHIESYLEDDFARHNSTVMTTADSGNMGNGNSELTILGDLLSEGDITQFDGHTQTNITGEVESDQDLPEPTPTEELLLDTKSPNYESGDGDLNGGIYHADDLTLTSDITVKRQSILIVNGDLTIDKAEIEVLESLDVHVHGSLILEGNDDVITTSEDHEAERVSFFVTDDIEISGQPVITGLIHATESTSIIDQESLTVYGAMTVNDITGHQNHGQFTLYYDEKLEGASPYATNRIESVGAIKQIFGEYSGDVHHGDYTLENGNLNDELLVKGEATVRNSNLEDNFLIEEDAKIESSNLRNGFDTLAVGGDLELEDSSVKGDVWVDGDATITGTSHIEGDLFVNGDVVWEGTETIDGNIYVIGDLVIANDLNTNGDIHVVGDVDLDAEPTSNVYVDGDVDVWNNLNGELHASGDVVCHTPNVNELHVGEDSEYDGCGTPTSTGNPTPPQIPGYFLPAPEFDGVLESNSIDHYFDIRIAHIEVE